MEIYKKKKEQVYTVQEISNSIDNKIADIWNISDVERYRKCVWEITNFDNNLYDLFYEYSLTDKSSYNFDFAILKAIIQYSKIPDKEDSNKKNSDRIIKLIKMVIDWKRCDLAKSEIFDENIEWVKF